MSIVLVMVALATPAIASEGVLEINQACAAGGCFAGDSPGFPVSLSTAGSYRLTSNLAVPANTTAIEIAINNVTLDLGGFEVKGPNTCSGYPVSSCVATAGASGVRAATANEFLAVVRNGKVTGFAGDCVSLEGNSSTVEKVSAFWCGSNGIRTGFSGRVVQSFSGNSFEAGIFIGDGGLAEGNEARGNRQSGIALQASLVGGTVIGNRVFQNGSVSVGAFGSANYFVSRNVLGTPPVISFSGSPRSLSDNLCSNTFC